MKTNIILLAAISTAIIGCSDSKNQQQPAHQVQAPIPVYQQPIAEAPQPQAAQPVIINNTTGGSNSGADIVTGMAVGALIGHAMSNSDNSAGKIKSVFPAVYFAS